MKLLMRISAIKRNYIVFTFATLIIISGMISCNDHNVATPKPRSFPKVEFPEKEYQKYKSKDCSFQFDYPTYANIEAARSFFDDPNFNPCWFDIVIPEFNGRLHCSHYELTDKNELDSLIFDSFYLVGKHTIKAQYINETVIDLPGKGGGVLFNISGPVATPTQFFITDSTNNFFRASLYFNNKVQIDSMGIIYDFINEDIERMLETFVWE